MSKCNGCGAKLQNDEWEKEGYTEKKESQLCQRCFRIQHYNEYQKSLKSNQDYVSILKNINRTNSFVILVIDLFHTILLDEIKKYLSNDMIIVLTKRDILPYSLYEKKLIQYFQKEFENVKDIIIVSSKNNYHYDELYHSIQQHKSGNEIYIVGYTNAGKSTLINQLMYHYGKTTANVTTSILPSTTLDTIVIPWQENLKLIDTPGLLEKDSIVFHLTQEELKKVIPKTEIKPRIYQIKEAVYFKVDDFFRLYIAQKGNVVFYFSNMLDIDRVFKQPKDIENYKKVSIAMNEDEDFVITGMGFIKCKAKMEITFYIKEYMHYYKRKSYI